MKKIWIIPIKDVKKAKEKGCDFPSFEIKAGSNPVYRRNVSGYINGISFVEKDIESEGKKYHVKNVNIELADEDGEYYLSLGLGGDCNSILSSLLSGDFEKEFNFSIYSNKEGYANISLFQNNEMLKWNDDYKPIDDYKALVETETLKDGTVKKYTQKLDEKYIGLIDRINSLIPDTNKKQTKIEDLEVSSGEELPF